ncbi:MAG: bifunctional 23S rRNA (guanine(2069)-N(7))-methyltransferase RlmK/23S rRNA (guanine(2445)-N(2))-methyltransferase RlmL, partial [Pirellulales bacterium]
EALELALPEFSERLVGTDTDERVLSAARRNAQQAGVSDQVHFQQKSFSELSSQRNHGCVITNPPYGKRIGEQRELESLYHSIPEVLRKLPTWSHFILTAYPDFEGVIERQADRRRKLYNGRIECTYYQFHGPKQREAAEPSNAAAVFGGLSEKVREQADLFGRRLQKRARHLRRWPTKQGITCYRLYERDVPEIPLIVDRYEDHLHITEYDRPHDRDAGQHADWLDLMMRKAAEVLDVDHRKVFLKCRRRQRGRSQHEQLADRRYEVTVREAGLRFIVNLSDYVDTGLFLDHRITRSMVREAAEGATFLNLFGYTGGFTVYAAAGGAARTTTVDWSHTYLDWSKRNLCLNEFESERHRFVRADAASYLQQLPRHETYDLAVVDPPTFSNRKGVDDHWDVQRDHVELLNELILRMKPGGQIFFSTNFRRFKLDEAAIQSASIFEISRQTVPSDFRNRRVHRCWRLRRET